MIVLHYNALFFAAYFSAGFGQAQILGVMSILPRAQSRSCRHAVPKMALLDVRLLRSSRKTIRLNQFFASRYLIEGERRDRSLEKLSASFRPFRLPQIR